MFGIPKHFRNFLGVPGSALCSAAEQLPPVSLTLVPEDVTCDRCLGLLGRLRDGNFAIPSEDPPGGKKP